MAEASISVNHDLFMCSVCLDLLKDPVTIPCGHSYCMVCINQCWDLDHSNGVYRCPQCRNTFHPRPVLHRNNMLAQVVEKLKKKSGDSYLTFLSYLMWMIVLICLACFMSPESVWKPVQNYQLLDLNTDKMDKAPGKICSEHDKALEVYCRTDQSFICYLCMMDKHKGHDTVSVISEREEKQVGFFFSFESSSLV